MPIYILPSPHQLNFIDMLFYYFHLTLYGENACNSDIIIDI